MAKKLLQSLTIYLIINTLVNQTKLQMCVFFRIFVCAKKKEKAPICTVQRYEEFWTCASNRPDKINCERKMSLMAHLIGRVRGACRQRRVFNPSCPHHKSDGSLSLLREAYVGRTQLPLPQDPVYGMAGTPYRPDTEDAPHGMYEQGLWEENLRRTAGDDTSLWSPHL